MTILFCFPKFRRRNEGFTGSRVEQSLAFQFQATIGHDQSERSASVLAKMRSNFLGKVSSANVRMLESGEGNVLFENLSDVIGNVDDLVKFARGRGEGVGDGEGAGEVESAIDVIDFTMGGKRDRLVCGGSGIHP